MRTGYADHHEKPPAANASTTASADSAATGSGSHDRASTRTASASSPISGRPYDIITPQPSSSPAATDHATIDPRDERVAAIARQASPHAATAAKTASAETAMKTAAGVSTRKGAARRAIASAPSARNVTITASAVVAAITVTTRPAARSPPRPTFTSPTKKSSAPGGCPAGWVGQLSGAE